ncbi:MAG: phospholipase [Rhizobacter sp.]|nr:phospholipase [Rhizobacter sp.]
MTQARREFLRSVATVAGATAALTTFPPAIARALSIEANRRTGTMADVEHIVILMQENRSFDHYFGTLNGVRGFADRFPIPVPDSAGIVGKNVWYQPNNLPTATPAVIGPFRLNTVQSFEVMRVNGTPHSWPDAQVAWNHGKLDAWPRVKQNHSMGHFAEADMPFQWALANAFTLCDAYHSSMQAGTNPNRLFQWTGTNDPLAKGNGPATYNDYDWFDADFGDGGYSWTTYPERLQAAGISWQVYENMADQFTDNPLAGFQTFRAAFANKPGSSAALRERGVSTRDLDKLRDDVMADKLPQVSFIVATAEGSEHPGPSSPAQGADYTAKVLDALTSNPDVWSKTVLFLNFDENDGFFDHVPPPAAPSYVEWNANPALAKLAGGSTVDTTGEYHEVLVSYHAGPEAQLLHRPYGLGPRVPMYVISPWSKGGWVNSQVFDHTSVLRFIEKRFNVQETNISPWRRAVCGDLTSAFNFADPNDDAFFASLPATLAQANRARALGDNHATPVLPATTTLPVQADGVRPSRALPYDLQATGRVMAGATPAATQVQVTFTNTGSVAGVFHVYDRLALTEIPRRYTVEPGKQLVGSFALRARGAYDLWVLGPNGFHRHLTGNGLRPIAAGQPNPDVQVACDAVSSDLVVKFVNSGAVACSFTITANKYVAFTQTVNVMARSESVMRIPLASTNRWYDLTVTVKGQTDYSRRFAGRLENGAPSVSDPAMFGPAIGEQLKIG